MRIVIAVVIIIVSIGFFNTSKAPYLIENELYKTIETINDEPLLPLLHVLTGIQQDLPLMERRIKQDRGFATRVTAMVDNVSFTFHFVNSIDAHSTMVQEAIQQYIAIFLLFNEKVLQTDSFVMYVENAYEGSRSRSPHPLAGDLLVCERLFFNAPTRHGHILSMLFMRVKGVTLPAWFLSGLQDYWQQSTEIKYINDEALTYWLQKNDYIGDFWLINQFNEDITSARNISYTLVQRWSNKGILLNILHEAKQDTDIILKTLLLYLHEMGIEPTNTPNFTLFYHFGDIEIITEQGIYFFLEGYIFDDYEQLQRFILYMDAGSLFLRDLLHVSPIAPTITQFYPGLLPSSHHPVDLPHGYAIPPRSIFIAYANLGIFLHELTHIYSFIFSYGAPPSWLMEGLALLCEILWSTSEANPFPREIHNVKDMHTASFLGDTSTPLPRLSPSVEAIFTTYHDGGSFVIFLYDNFGFENILAFYRDARNSGDNSALSTEVFGYTMPELISQWQIFLYDYYSCTEQ